MLPLLYSATKYCVTLDTNTQNPTNPLKLTDVTDDLNVKLLKTSKKS